MLGKWIYYPVLQGADVEENAGAGNAGAQAAPHVWAAIAPGTHCSLT